MRKPQYPDLRISATRFVYKIVIPLAIPHPIPQNSVWRFCNWIYAETPHAVYLL